MRRTANSPFSPPTLHEQAKATEEADRQAVLESPLVRAAMAAFPDAELVNWKR